MYLSLDTTEGLYALLCVVVRSYHGSPGGVLEIEELSPSNINKTCFICICKIVYKVKLEDVIRTVDWFLIFTPFASLPLYSGELREILREAKALCNDTLVCGPAHV